MAIVQGAWGKLLSPGLAKAFIEAYLDTMYEDPPVRELHVVDLGEGMLVPTELLRDLFGHQLGWIFSTEMVEDDLYGFPKKAIGAVIKAEADKIDKAILEKADSFFPLKPFLTDQDSWFLIEEKMAKFGITNPSQYFGKSMSEMLAKPATVAIPKNPKQITKATLEHFHKLLGGKKNPF